MIPDRLIDPSPGAAAGTRAQPPAVLAAATAPAHLALEKLPLCSFGPGGSYVVDWEVDGGAVVSTQGYPARTLGSAVHRVAGRLLSDLAGWLIARHPARQYRLDSCPDSLDPCVACGYSDRWPLWFAAGARALPWQLVEAGAGTVAPAGATLVAATTAGRMDARQQRPR